MFGTLFEMLKVDFTDYTYVMFPEQKFAGHAVVCSSINAISLRVFHTNDKLHHRLVKLSSLDK